MTYLEKSASEKHFKPSCIVFLTRPTFSRTSNPTVKSLAFNRRLQNSSEIHQILHRSQKPRRTTICLQEQRRKTTATWLYLRVSPLSKPISKDGLFVKNTISMNSSQEYFEEKAKAASRDVFLMFSPTWLSSFEKTFLWMAGFKPGLAFRLVSNSVEDLNEEQRRRLERLRLGTRVEEKDISDELARVQESVASPPLLELARRAGREAGGERRNVDEAIETLRNSMEILLECAETLRANTAMKVVDILNPAQTVRFLASAAKLQLRIRNWGLQKDAERDVP